MKVNNIIIGKRVTLGAAVTSIAAAAAHIFPDHAPAIISVAVPVTFVLQVLIANKMSITQ